MASARIASARQRNSRIRKRCPRTAAFDFAQTLPAAQRAPRRIRGLKLRTVSALVLAFSLLCLGAFVAGHSPIPHRQTPAWLSAHGSSSQSRPSIKSAIR